MIWLGGLIVLLTFVAIIKKYETRMVLFLSGLLMAILSGKPLEAITAFQAAMINGGLVPVICTVMGFAFVMRLTKCDSHLVHLLAGPLTKFRAILIPGAVLVTWTINIALPSAAAVGAILIPALMAAGVHPAMAASAVLAGTWGSVISPGNSHNPFVAKLANVDVMTVIATLSSTALITAVVVAIGLTITAFVRKENQGYTSEVTLSDKDEFKVNILKAVVPMVPLILLVLGSKQLHVIPEVTVPQAMIFGAILGFVVTWQNPQEITKQFFNGMGDAYGNVIGIIIAAAVFTKGMELIGLTGSLIAVMKNSQSIAKFAATFGPFVVAILSGSGDAAALAFNGAITPHAKQFGYGIIEMGSTAQMVGALGRSMSPVAGAAIVCAQLAKVSPIEMTKRNGPIMLLGAIVMMMGML
ncbi:C4-dicarboxylate ABC transporter [Anaerosporomusa subterranea]|uniref:C4-dicarboxylate ABC transporter n=1 Tax=Anaerosporomusa subterranea TaxID=1794912 RepID=A0A154BU29_ANASB|nr:C4-dicarboxylate transporter DcuC [Anaerosporomusa subterranea]KYZ77375.1 C4-dicarboxylate ABC transporter [Anaerosporomusa subterranea]